MSIVVKRKLSEARQAFEQAMALRPRFAEASYNLGIILSRLGDANGRHSVCKII
jgi:Flp pilus assembly protein TadD